MLLLKHLHFIYIFKVLPVGHRLIENIRNNFVRGGAHGAGVAVYRGDVSGTCIIIKILKYLLEALLIVLPVGKANLDLDGKAVRAGLRYAVDLLDGGWGKVIGHDITIELQVAIARHQFQIGIALEIIFQVLRKALGEESRPLRRVVQNGRNRDGAHGRVNVGAIE